MPTGHWKRYGREVICNCLGTKRAIRRPTRNAISAIRTHYVDDDTLRYHHSRVLSARHVDGGLLFAIICSDALDMRNTSRGFRYSIFDLFGTVIERPDLEHAFKTSRQAEKAMWAALNNIDAVAHTLAAIEKARKGFAAEMDELTKEVRTVATNKIAA